MARLITEKIATYYPAIYIKQVNRRGLIMNKNTELLPYYYKAKKLLDYNRTTGQFTWKVSRGSRSKVGGIAGHENSHGYIAIGVNLNKKQKFLKAHRLAWFIVNHELPNVIDHIDRDKSNNSLSNLRDCNNSLNQINIPISKRNTTGYKGVYYRKDNGKYRAIIKIDGRNKSIGQYETAEEAYSAYKKKAIEVYGDFCCFSNKGD